VVVQQYKEQTELIIRTEKQLFSNIMSVNDLSNGSAGSTAAQETIANEEPSCDKNETLDSVQTDLPLTGDYVGIGGPDAVPLETQGAFEKPDKIAGNLLDDLFMSPSETQLLSMQKTLSNIEISKNKTRLKTCVGFHFMLFVLMALKLLPEVLDKLDVFVLEIEELLIPKPQLWEWIWASSAVPAAIAWLACKKSKAFNMKISQALNVATGLIPVFLGMSYHFSDLYEFISGNGDENIKEWMNYPICVLWYAFLFVALQVHAVEIYISKTLIDAWQVKKKK